MVTTAHILQSASPAVGKSNFKQGTAGLMRVRTS